MARTKGAKDKQPRKHREPPAPVPGVTVADPGLDPSLTSPPDRVLAGISTERMLAELARRSQQDAFVYRRIRGALMRRLRDALGITQDQIGGFVDRTQGLVALAEIGRAPRLCETAIAMLESIQKERFANNARQQRLYPATPTRTIGPATSTNRPVPGHQQH